MPNDDESGLRPSEDRNAMRVIQDETVNEVGSADRPLAPRRAGRRDRRRATGASAQCESRAATPGAATAPVRPALRILPGPSFDEVDAAVEPTGDAPRAEALPGRDLGPRWDEPSLAGSQERATLAGSQERATLCLAPVRSIAAEIRAATTVIGGWVELVELGMLTEDELAVACQRIRAAQARIEAAGEQLELAAGISHPELP